MSSPGHPSAAPLTVRLGLFAAHRTSGGTDPPAVAPTAIRMPNGRMGVWIGAYGPGLLKGVRRALEATLERPTARLGDRWRAGRYTVNVRLSWPRAVRFQPWIFALQRPLPGIRHGCGGVGIGRGGGVRRMVRNRPATAWMTPCHGQPCRHVRRKPAAGRQAAWKPAAQHDGGLRPPRRRASRRGGGEGWECHCRVDGVRVPEAVVAGRSGRRRACPPARVDHDLIPHPVRQTGGRDWTPGVRRQAGITG